MSEQGSGVAGGIVWATARSPVAWAYWLHISALAVLFGPALGGADRLAFRDAGHFYTPLYGYLATQERQHWLPLFNPLDVTGIPLAGETTTAVFYPLRRLVYWLAPSAEPALAWYVVLHLLLASVTGHYAAAVAGARRGGQALAILGYPLAGPVLFLYCNPPFLVGAAWCPLALAGGFQLLRQTRPYPLAITSIGLAMPILGGDPQISLHVMLIGLVAAVVTLLRNNCPPSLRHRSKAMGRGKRAISLLGSLAATVGLTALLVCPQLAASLDWAKQSIRYSPLSGQHAADVYAFSVAPWHWLELVMPAASGQLFPVYTRISHLIADDGKTWAITLYAGLIPLALAVNRYRQTPWRRLDLWDSIAPLGLAMALGSFGLGYALRTVLPLATLSWEDATGGPYWWSVQLVPGYAGFRYPAKWLVFVPLGIAIAAARQASCLTFQRRQQFAHTIFAVAVVASMIAGAIVIGLDVTARQLPELLAIADPFWGPLQWQVAARNLAFSALAVNAIAAVAFWVSRCRLMPQAINCTFVGLLAVDLVIASWPSVATVARGDEAHLLAAVAPHSAASREQQVEQAAEPARGQRAMRFVASHAWPPEWGQTRSAGQRRMLTVEASQRNTYYGRWHLLEDRAVFNPVTSLPPHRAQSFWRAANALSRQTATPQKAEYWDRLLGWLAVDSRWDVVVAASDPTASHQIDSDNLLDLRVSPVRASSLAVCWLPQCRVIDEQRWISPQTFAQRLREVTADSPPPPLVELPPLGRDRLSSLAARADLSGELAAEEALKSARIEVVQRQPDRWTIRVDSAASGLLCIKQFQDGNWQASVKAVTHGSGATANERSLAAVPVFRCDYLFSAVEVPAGRSEVVLRYRPWWLLPTIALSVLAWGITIALLGLAKSKPVAAGDGTSGGVGVA